MRRNTQEYFFISLYIRGREFLSMAGNGALELEFHRGTEPGKIERKQFTD
jgi:hypothetical protein